jgi:hypothetical protein
MQSLMYQEDLPTSLYLHTGEPGERVIRLTLSAGMDTDFENKRKFVSVLRTNDLTDLSKFEKWEAWLKTPSPQNRDLFTGEAVIAHSQYSQNTSGRRLILTAKGYIGFAPEQCKVGDLVAVLAGGKAPYVLRLENSLEQEVSRKCYSILGDAYIHGVMDGEFVKELGVKGGRWKKLYWYDWKVKTAGAKEEVLEDCPRKFWTLLHGTLRGLCLLQVC